MHPSSRHYLQSGGGTKGATKMSKQENGYVLLHRKLFDNKIWLLEKFTKAQAWIDLFANANHADGSFWVRGIEIQIKRGQIGWSQIKMAQRWGWSREKVRRFLFWLESEGNIVIETRHQNDKLKSIITIINYNSYQSRENKKVLNETSNETTNKTSNETTDEAGTKNDKEELKNDKEEYIAETSSAKEFIFSEYIKILEDSNRRDLNIIALYFDNKKPDIKSLDQARVAVKRHLRPAKQLTPFTDEQILKAIPKAKQSTPDWTIETLVKIVTK